MKVCFVGAGSIGRRHIRNLYHLLQGKEITIDLLRSGNGAALNFELTSYIHKIYSSIDDLDPDYDAIFITNPTSCHFSSILQLQHLTKSFFVEKPVFNTTQINLEDSGIDLKKLIYVAAPMRYTAIIQYIKQHLDMSQALSIRCICSTYLPNWHPNEDYRTSYSAHKDLGGGVSIDLIHEWDYITYLLGFPQKTYSIIKKISTLEIDSDDIAIYIAQYAHQTVELHLDYFGRKETRYMDIFFPNDTIHCDFIKNTITYQVTNKCLSFSEERDDYQTAELRYFLDLLSGNRINENSIYNAYSVLKLAKSEPI